ncbi:MAG: hypothetical protein ABL997_07940 [Planctomycetota bacterium]
MSRAFARAALALLLTGLAATAASQEAAAASGEDWQKHVERACTPVSYTLRVSASKKVAAGGDAAMPFVRAWSDQHGINSLPVVLVEAIATSAGNGRAVLDSLRAWAMDRDFYWRAQALRGLALRAKEDEAIRAEFAPVFAQFVEDPAWLMRTFARWIVDDPTRDFDVEIAQGQVVRSPESDPRARTKLAALRGGARELFAALRDARTFLGDPWGKRRAEEALAALARVLGTDGGYRFDATASENDAALLRLADAVAVKDSGSRPVTAPENDPQLTFSGGIEILSCKHGDLFLRWTEDGLVQGGSSPDCPQSHQIAPLRWAELLRGTTTLDLPQENGVVICDKLRIHVRPDRAQAAVAPAALPQPAADWLKQLAAAIEESGDPSLAGALRQRLQQFVSTAAQAR